MSEHADNGTEETGAGYELLAERLRTQASTLADAANELNAARVETFGASRFEVAGTERVRTENNTVPRDIAAVGGDMLFGYNVFIGLKSETTVDDVFQLHHYRNDESGLSLDVIADDHTDNWLHDPQFVSDFAELYQFYKDARLIRIQRREGRLLMVFQTGGTTGSRRVFRWSVDPDGNVSYIDKRGDGDYSDPPQFDFEWETATRADHVDSRNPYINLANKVFVSPVDGTLSLKLEDNTPAGETLLEEPVENAQQLADCIVKYAVLGEFLVLNVTPYGETESRGFIVNTFTRTAARNDSVLSSCYQLPEDHGLITADGYALKQGEQKQFELEFTGLSFDNARRSPNGEDILYVFHEKESGISALLSYNMIRREMGTPILAHGWSLFDDGSLVVFREDDEPTRIHQMQIWETPFVSDEFHARQPVGGTLMHKVGNAELVRGVSEALTITKQIRDATPSSAVYDDIAMSAARTLDAHHWLTEEELGNMAAPLTDIRATAGLIIAEFEKVTELKRIAENSVTETTAEIEALIGGLSFKPPTDANAHVASLRELRRHRGHVITMSDTRYVDLASLDALNDQIVEAFDKASDNAARYFAEETAFTEFHTTLTEIEGATEASATTLELSEVRTRVDDLNEGLDVLAEIVTGLNIEDPTVRTGILDRLSDVTAGINRTRALINGKDTQLKNAEGTAAFAVEMTLLTQSVTSEMGRISDPDSADEALSRLMLQLENMETRFAEYDSGLADIATKRDEIYEAVTTRKQGLLDERQSKAERLLITANRILETVSRRTETFNSDDEINSFFAGDPMVDKVRDIANQLQELDQPIQADEMLARLNAAREDAGRSRRDRSDIYEDGGKAIRFGKHRFSVDTEPLTLTAVTSDNQLYATLTGTDFRHPLEMTMADESFFGQRLPTETNSMPRAAYLAATIHLDQPNLADSELEETVQAAAQADVAGGYERGVHDHDALLILKALRSATKDAGLLRYPPEARAAAISFWGSHDEASRNSLAVMAKAAVRLAEEFGDEEPLESLAANTSRVDGGTAHSRYLIECIAASANHDIKFIIDSKAHQLAQAIARDHGEDIKELISKARRRSAPGWGLLKRWVASYIAVSAPEHAALTDEVAAIIVFRGDGNSSMFQPQESDMDLQVKGLLGGHKTVTGGVWEGRADHLLNKADDYRTNHLPAFLEYQQHRNAALNALREELRLDEFEPKIMGSFVRNRLIDDVYLHLIGDNFAKQLGSLDSTRTDQSGLLLLISPPGYGKTTLMEYVANRLGMVFVKVNGPALGHGVTSLDPTEAPDATAAQEVNKVNFALEMGSNVLLYVDDIQHTNPEFLQKFISMTDAQRRMEGMWDGDTRTYDMRGKRFAVVMAGNPYTESGETFSIPDMLANRADTYNLGDMLSGKEDVFALSYIENAVASNETLKPMTTRDIADVAKLVDIAKGGDTTGDDLSHPYSASDLADMTATMKHLLRVQEVVLAVNQSYIASAATGDDYRTEPAFKLQGSYRNMAKLAEKVVPAMNREELEALIDDHYLGEAQTLAADAEANLLKLGELRGTLTAEQTQRWKHIKSAFAQRRQEDMDGSVVIADAINALSDVMKASSSAVSNETIDDGVPVEFETDGYSHAEGRPVDGETTEATKNGS